jgi:hypothetical protein
MELLDDRCDLVMRPLDCFGNGPDNGVRSTAGQGSASASRENTKYRVNCTSVDHCYGPLVRELSLQQ